MAPRDPIVVLTTRGRLHYLLLNALLERFNVSAVVYEAQGPRALWRRFSYRARRQGIVTALGQVALTVWDRMWLTPRSAPYAEGLLAGHADSCPDSQVSAMDVDSINDSRVAELLRRTQPAVCVVSGTTIIRPHILQTCPIFLNIHAGITPRYRGCHGAFWAIYEGRPDLAGVTIHLVDEGVDTGAVVAQAIIDVDHEADTYRTVGIKQYLAGIPLLVEAVSCALENRLQTRPPPDLISKQWWSPTLSDYIRWRRRMRELAATGGPSPHEHQSAEGMPPRKLG